MAAKRPPTGTRTTTPTPPPSATTTTTTKLTPAAQFAHDRFTLLLLNLVGTRVLVTVKGGQQIKGILATASTDSGELSIVLRQAQAQSPSTHSTETNGNGNGNGAAEKPKEEPVKSALIIQGRDLVGVETCEEVELVGLPSIANPTTTTTTSVKATEEQQKPIERERESFKTDTDISGLNQSRGEKQLKAWGGGGDSSSLDDLSLSLDGPSSSASPSLGGGRGGGGQWDQFATNERLYGVKTDYHEEMYTTKLDRSGADYKERAKRAAILEQEIMKGSHSSALASNAHMNEERGINPQGVDDNGLDEEDRYGAVIRGPSAYVPPGARKAAAALSARLGTTPPPPPPTTAPSSAPLAPATLPPNGAAPGSTADWVTVSKKGLPVKGGVGPPTIPAIQEPTQRTASAAPSSRPVPDLEPTFRQFVSNEKERLTQKRNAAVKAAEKAEQDTRLKSLLQFSQTFKLPKNVSEASTDMASILGHDPVKKTSSTAATPISSPSRPAPRTLAPAPNATSKPPAHTPATTSSRSSSLLPEIPPFKGKSVSSTTTTPAVSPKPSSASIALPNPTASTSKINPNAKPFVFKPNPNASAFTPSFASAGAGAGAGAASPSPATAPAATPASATARKATADLPPGNAFFGNKTVKKGSSSMHVKEDFTPFGKHGQIQSPEQVAPTWSFTSRPYRQAYSISPSPTPINDDDQGQGQGQVPGSSGSGATNGGGGGGPSHLPPIPPPQGIPIQQQGQGGPTFVYQPYQPGGFPQRFAQPPGQQPPQSQQQPNQQQQPPPQALQHMLPPPGAMGFHQFPPPPPPMGFNPNQQGGPHGAPMYTPSPGMQPGQPGPGGVAPPPPLNPQAYMRFAQFPPGQQNGVPIGFVDPARSMAGP